MGESIRRGQTPTLGQKSLQDWLDSPQRTNPILDQSTRLGIVLDLFRFQTRRRYQSLTSSLAGGDTIVAFQATVPEDEMWFIELLTIGHDSAANRRVFEMTVRRPNLMPLPQIVARVAILAGATIDQQAMPLIGGTLFQVASFDDLFNQPDGLLVSPGSQITVQNLSVMIAPESANFRIKYRLLPLPLDEELATLFVASQA